mmetsp:Transcript_26714/g.48485  ORF Transcript_26714/g.48485 Transcript_26714/m.48485 type:complete len:80 (+) Transcript_26714:158-397(+)
MESRKRLSWNVEDEGSAQNRSDQAGAMETVLRRSPRQYRAQNQGHLHSGANLAHLLSMTTNELQTLQEKPQLLLDMLPP